jgi:TetR/AcrR family transcriptional regulator
LDWVRARSDKQIKQRIDEIIKATARLYESHRFEEITFAMIAREANFTRSNLYRYFNTRENIFLELLKHDIADWRKEILEINPDGFRNLQLFSEIWVETLQKHQRMIKLFTILYTQLEQNSSLEALTEFKQKLLEELALVAEFLVRKLPFPSIESATEFLFAQSFMAIGTYPMLELTPKQKQAMETVGMDTSPQYFKRIFTRSIHALLKGVMNIP